MAQQTSPSPATETTPLVGATDELSTTTTTTSSPALTEPPIQVQPQPPAWRGAARAHVLKWRVLYLMALFAFLVDFPTFMAEAAKLRMLELGLCREHYRVADPGVIRGDGSIPEQLCKAREVQSALARMRGFLSLVEYIPGLTLAVPYGILADMRGRRLVLALSALGIILSDVWLWAILYFYKSFPLRAVYSAPALVAVGGGSTVLIATSLAVVAAAVPEENRFR
jgi:MFS family permease